MKKYITPRNITILIACVACAALCFVVKSAVNSTGKQQHITFTRNTPQAGTALYNGPVYHIFFHSLIVYPELAFRGDKRSNLFATYMITRYEFTHILPELYARHFVLIDAHELYTVDSAGDVHKKDLYLPSGKKPLILSVDDVNYYQNQQDRGLAHKLVLDDAGKIATEVVAPDGSLHITHDGDIMPILDSFVTEHPDFSFNGAKGVLAVTGYDGVLGYRTPYTPEETEQVKKVVSELKATGWIFASHSYTHDHVFLTGDISLAQVQEDTEKWNQEVRPLVGDTDIFIGPFGQIFPVHDARRAYLISQGFHMLAGVGMDLYTEFFPRYVAMDRAAIDGMRLLKNAHRLHMYFDTEKVIDPARKS